MAWQTKIILKLKILFCSLLVLFAFLKIASIYHSPNIFRGAFLFLGSLFEIGFGIIIFTKFEVWGYYFLLCFFASGALLTIVFPEFDCGCLGTTFVLGFKSHILLSAILGFWTTFLLYLHPFQSRTR